jgi:hypothetical protein
MVLKMMQILIRRKGRGSLSTMILRETRVRRWEKRGRRS